MNLDHLTKEISPLRDVFITEAIKLGYNNDESISLFSELPMDIRNTKARKMGFENPLPWRYEYGLHFSINKKAGIGFPFHFPKVSNLILALTTAKRHLNPRQYKSWRYRFGHKAQHFDAINEILAILNVQSGSKLFYEKEGTAIGKKPIDWLVETENLSFLLEVKVRLGQVPLHFEQESKINKSVPYEPIPNIEKIFTGITDKFFDANESTFIQGVAIFPSLKIPKSPFINYFTKNVKQKLHFVALVRIESPEVNIIANSEEIKTKVLSTFGWTDTADFLMDEVFHSD